MAGVRSHAAERLAERYGLDLSPWAFALFEAGFSDPRRRLDRTRMRLYRTSRSNGRPSTIWLVNLQEWLGHEAWALAIFDEGRRHLVTFLPPPRTLKYRDVMCMLGKKASRGTRRRLPSEPSARSRGRPRAYPGSKRPDWLEGEDWE